MLFRRTDTLNVLPYNKLVSTLTPNKAHHLTLLKAE